jgi:hypothetical protein
VADQSASFVSDAMSARFLAAVSLAGLGFDLFGGLYHRFSDEASCDSGPFAKVVHAYLSHNPWDGMYAPSGTLEGGFRPNRPF